MRTFRQYAVAAGLVLATVAAGSAPAFAWGAGAPDSAYSVYYEQPAQQAKPQARAYYNYVAPGQHRRPALTQNSRTNSSVDTNEDSTPPIGGFW
jgi:hypothetical protein